MRSALFVLPANLLLHVTKEISQWLIAFGGELMWQENNNFIGYKANAPAFLIIASAFGAKPIIQNVL